MSSSERRRSRASRLRGRASRSPARSPHAAFICAATSTYPFSTLYINAPPNTPFAAELKRTLAGGSTTLMDTAAAAQAILDLSNITDDKQVLSLSGGGRAREYLLTKRLTFALHDAAGKDWLPAGEIVVRRSYTFNESEVLARESEEAKLLKEMQTDAVQQVVRRLQSAKKPV